MTRRLTLITFTLASAFVLAGLLVGAATDRRPTAFAPGVPDNTPVITLHPGQGLCQGPIEVAAGFDAVEVWASPIHALAVEIRRAPGGKLLSNQRIGARPTPDGTLTVPVRGGAIRAGERIDLCLRNLARRPLAFAGGAPTPQSGRITFARQQVDYAVAVLFLRSQGPSLLSLLPHVFARAALFKLDGAGAWTFWLLGAALIGAFGVAGLAVVAAAGAEGESEDAA